MVLLILTVMVAHGTITTTGDVMVVRGTMKTSAPIGSAVPAVEVLHHSSSIY